MLLVFVLDPVDATSPERALRAVCDLGLIGRVESLVKLGTRSSRWRLVVEPVLVDDKESVDTEPGDTKRLTHFADTVVHAATECKGRNQHLIVLLRAATHSTAAARRRLVTHVRAKLPHAVNVPSSSGERSAQTCEWLLVLCQIAWPPALQTDLESWWKPWLRAWHGITPVRPPVSVDDAVAATSWGASSFQSLPLWLPTPIFEAVTANEGWALVRQVSCDPCAELSDACTQVFVDTAAPTITGPSPELCVLDLSSRTMLHDDPLLASATKTTSSPFSDAVALVATVTAICTEPANGVTLIVLVPETTTERPMTTPSAHLTKAALCALHCGGFCHYTVHPSQRQRGVAPKGSTDDSDGAEIAPPESCAELYRSPGYLATVSSLLLHGLTLVQQELSSAESQRSRAQKLAWLCGRWRWLLDPSCAEVFSEASAIAPHSCESPLFDVHAWDAPTVLPLWSAPLIAEAAVPIRVSASFLREWVKAAACVTRADTKRRLFGEDVQLDLCEVDVRAAPQSEAHLPIPSRTPVLLLGACLRCVSVEGLEAGGRWLQSSANGDTHLTTFRTCTACDGRLLPLLMVSLTDTHAPHHVTSLLLSCGNVVLFSCGVCGAPETVVVPTASTAAAPPCVHVSAILHACTRHFLAAARASSVSAPPRQTLIATKGDTKVAEGRHTAPQNTSSLVSATGLPAFMLRGQDKKRSGATLPRAGRRATVSATRSTPVPSDGVGRKRHRFATNASPEPLSPPPDAQSEQTMCTITTDKTPQGQSDTGADDRGSLGRFSGINQEWRVTSQNEWHCEWDYPSQQQQP